MTDTRHRKSFTSILGWFVVEMHPIRLDVQLQAAGFTPCAEFRAKLIIYLNENPEKQQQQIGRDQHKVIRKLSPVPSGESSPRVDLDRRELAYVVCQLAGRWMAERNWIVPFVYNSEEEGMLSTSSIVGNQPNTDNNNTTSSTTTTTTPKTPTPQLVSSKSPVARVSSLEDSNSKDKVESDIPAVCQAALDDALHWGSCGVEGYSGFIFKYPPQVIISHQSVTSEQSLVIHLSCKLPDCIPPTFRGVTMKYQYLLAVVAADAIRVDKPQVLRIPLIITTSHANSVVEPIYIPRTVGPNYCNRKISNSTFRVHICTMPSHNNIQRAIALSPNGRITPFCKKEEDPRHFAVSYPISEESIFDDREDQVNDEMLWLIQEDNQSANNTFPYLSEKDIYAGDENSNSLYQIKQDSDVVCRLYIWKRAFRCGDSIVGFIDFSNCKVPCYRITIKLETEERVHPKACNYVSTTPLIFRKTYGERVEYPSFEQNAQFILTIPLDAPVSLESHAVSLLWILRFTFEIPDGSIDARDMKYSELLPVPLSEMDYLLQRNTKLLHWNLPLVVYGGDRFAFAPDTIVGLDLSYNKG